jgi:hypothetical protein
MLDGAQRENGTWRAAGRHDICQENPEIALVSVGLRQRARESSHLNPVQEAVPRTRGLFARAVALSAT